MISSSRESWNKFTRRPVLSIFQVLLSKCNFRLFGLREVRVRDSVRRFGSHNLTWCVVVLLPWMMGEKPASPVKQTGKTVTAILVFYGFAKI
jgi:hypothetical protein